MNIEELTVILKKGPHNLYRKLLEDLTTIHGFTPVERFAEYIYVDNVHPICLVAHIDTVERDKKLKLEIKNNIITAKDSVLGADDRAGVYAIMDVLLYCKEHNIAYPSVIFTNYEERGCLGVKEFIKDKKFNTDNVRLFVELDRKNPNDYVYYRFDCPKEVSEYIESFGYIKAHGSTSDVGDLTEEYKIPHVNLSVGYYAQHTKSEKLHIDELGLTISRVLRIISNPIDKLYEVKPRTTTVYGGAYNYEYDHYGYNTSWQKDQRNGFKNSVTVHDYKSKPLPAKIYILDRLKRELVEVKEETKALVPVDNDWTDGIFGY